MQDDKNNIVGIKFKNNKILKIDIEDKKRLKRKYMHYDFELYGKYLFNDNKVIVPNNFKEISENINYLDGAFLSEDLVKYRIHYLNNDFKKFNKLSLKEKILKHKYKLFTKDELDHIFDECSDMIINKIKEVGAINE